MKAEEGAIRMGFVVHGIPTEGAAAPPESPGWKTPGRLAPCVTQLPLSWVVWCHQFVLPVQAALLLSGEVEAVRAAPILLLVFLCCPPQGFCGALNVFFAVATHQSSALAKDAVSGVFCYLLTLLVPW